MKLDIAIDQASSLWDALPEAEVSVQLVDDAQIRALNAQWRGFDKATNVLSFPAAPAEKLETSPLLGDIVLAFETIEREADDMRISFSDHFVHLVVHGFLHLVGFDHQDSAEAERMEKLETQILADMAIADPYAADALAERE
jgi:probable rRNA maturation factor